MLHFDYLFINLLFYCLFFILHILFILFNQFIQFIHVFVLYLFVLNLFVLQDGSELGWEEYYDYDFPDDEKKVMGFKILENAMKWKLAAAAALAGKYLCDSFDIMYMII